MVTSFSLLLKIFIFWVLLDILEKIQIYKMEYDIKTILEKIIVPIKDSWKLSKLDIDETKIEVHVSIYYQSTKYKIGDFEYKLIDDRAERKWRHLDLWLHKTYIYCKLPRYKDQNNKVKSIYISKSEPYERMTWLLEKKL